MKPNFIKSFSSYGHGTCCIDFFITFKSGGFYSLHMTFFDPYISLVCELYSPIFDSNYDCQIITTDNNSLDIITKLSKI